jgi:hypothetical protein
LFLNSFEVNELIKSKPGLNLFIVNKINAIFDKNQFFGKPIVWIENPFSIIQLFKISWITIIIDKKKEGTHIKLIESIYYETPVIAYKESFRGYENIFNGDENQLVVENLNQLCKKVIFLVEDKNYLASISKKFKSRQTKIFSFKEISSRLKLDL